MPAFKSDIYITITTAGKSFRIGGAAFRKGYNVRKGDELKMRGEKVHNAGVKAAAEGSPATEGSEP